MEEGEGKGKEEQDTDEVGGVGEVDEAGETVEVDDGKEKKTNENSPLIYKMLQEHLINRKISQNYNINTKQ